MSMVKTDKLVFEYEKRDEEGNVIGTQRAIDEVDIQIEKGRFIAILGHNGSGKSTFAKHINALLVPGGGTMWVGGRDTKDEDELWNIRQSAGMVFQNPDNQIIATVVEEDVGFGPENLGVPTKEIWQRVDDALEKVGMTEYRYRSPNKLSGGQKQRVAIAGVVAMRPECIVLDEPTAMLDPNGRKEVIRTVRDLQKQEKTWHDGYFDYPLYGRSHGCGLYLCDGQGKGCDGGKAGADLFQGGFVKALPSGRPAGDSGGGRADQKGISGFSRNPYKRGALPGSGFPCQGAGKDSGSAREGSIQGRGEKPSGRGSGFASEESEL